MTDKKGCVDNGRHDDSEGCKMELIGVSSTMKMVRRRVGKSRRRPVEELNGDSVVEGLKEQPEELGE